MTKEQAARILDPSTTFEEISTIKNYNGLSGSEAITAAINDACRMGAKALLKSKKKKKKKS